MIQVFQNILGNAYKFTDESGMIQTKFIEKRWSTEHQHFQHG